MLYRGIKGIILFFLVSYYYIYLYIFELYSILFFSVILLVIYVYIHYYQKIRFKSLEYNKSISLYFIKKYIVFDNICNKIPGLLKVLKGLYFLFNILFSLFFVSVYIFGTRSSVVKVYENIFGYSFEVVYDKIKLFLIYLIYDYRSDLHYLRLNYSLYNEIIGRYLKSRESMILRDSEIAMYIDTVFETQFANQVDKAFSSDLSDWEYVEDWEAADRPMDQANAIMELLGSTYWFGLVMYLISCLFFFNLVKNLILLYRLLFWTDIEHLSYEYTKLYYKYLGRGNEVKGFYSIYRFINLYGQRNLLGSEFLEKKKKNYKPNNSLSGGSLSKLKYYGVDKNLENENILYFSDDISDKFIKIWPDHWRNYYFLGRVCKEENFNYGSSKLDEYLSNTLYGGDLEFFNFKDNWDDLEVDLVRPILSYENNISFMRSKSIPGYGANYLKKVNYENYKILYDTYKPIRDYFYVSDEDDEYLEDYIRDFLEYNDDIVEDYCDLLKSIWWEGRTKLGYGLTNALSINDSKAGNYYSLLSDSKDVLNREYFDEKIRKVEINFANNFLESGEKGDIGETEDFERMFEICGNMYESVIRKGKYGRSFFEDRLKYNYEKVEAERDRTKRWRARRRQSFKVGKDQGQNSFWRGNIYGQGYQGKDNKVLLKMSLGYMIYILFFLVDDILRTQIINPLGLSYPFFEGEKWFLKNYDSRDNYYVDCYLDFIHVNDTRDLFEQLEGEDYPVTDNYYKIFPSIRPYSIAEEEDFLYWYDLEITDVMEQYYDTVTVNLNYIYMELENRYNFFKIYFIYIFEKFIESFTFFIEYFWVYIRYSL